jgi:hypothetical protein
MNAGKVNDLGARNGVVRLLRNPARVVVGCGAKRIEARRSGRSILAATYESARHPHLRYTQRCQCVQGWPRIRLAAVVEIPLHAEL